QRHARRRQHAELLARGHEGPADRLGLGVDVGRDALVDPEQIGDDVEDSHRDAVPAQRGIVLDLGDLRANELPGRPHGPSLAHGRRQDKQRPPRGSRAIDAAVGEDYSRAAMISLEEALMTRRLWLALVPSLLVFVVAGCVSLTPAQKDTVTEVQRFADATA